MTSTTLPARAAARPAAPAVGTPEPASLTAGLTTDLTTELAALRSENANLKIALDTSRIIGAAVGIVMAATKATYDQAFALLVDISQKQNRKLRALADEIVRTGTVLAFNGKYVPLVA